MIISAALATRRSSHVRVVPCVGALARREGAGKYHAFSCAEVERDRPAVGYVGCTHTWTKSWTSPGQVLDNEAIMDN
ncbi:hypothetical protein MTO96_002933 [Rhipicephalus appendiculatus]